MSRFIVDRASFSQPCASHCCPRGSLRCGSRAGLGHPVRRISPLPHTCCRVPPSEGRVRRTRPQDSATFPPPLILTYLNHAGQQTSLVLHHHYRPWSLADMVSITSACRNASQQRTPFSISSNILRCSPSVGFCTDVYSSANRARRARQRREMTVRNGPCELLSTVSRSLLSHSS